MITQYPAGFFFMEMCVHDDDDDDDDGARIVRAQRPRLTPEIDGRSFIKLLMDESETPLCHAMRRLGLVPHLLLHSSL